MSDVNGDAAVEEVGPNEVGRRLREIRDWRGQTLEVTAGLAGISFGYLGKLERGEKPLESRQVLEGLAWALKVAPSEFNGRPWEQTDDPMLAQAHAGLKALEATLTGWRPGEVPDDTAARPWPSVTKDLMLLNEQLRPNSDYAGQGAVLPSLVHDLLIYVADDEHRRAALRGLIDAYHAIVNVVHKVDRLGSRGLSALAAERLQATAELLDDTELLGLAAWSRAQFVGAPGRARQYALAVAAAELPGTRVETRGMSHLTAAMAAAARGDADMAQVHLREASALADRLGLANSPWGDATMNFGTVNVGIWRVALGVELGQGARVAELGTGLQLSAISRSRQGAYWMDLGRGLLSEHKTRNQGLAALLRAERLTPQQVLSNVFVREAVADQLRTAKRDAGGRELRGLAYRLGLAPSAPTG
jgi:transcriptional regulator with XRE-family HTH domain